MIESLLGLRREGQGLRIQPSVPAAWPVYRLRYCSDDTVYRIHVTQSTLADAVKCVWRRTSSETTIILLSAFRTISELEMLLLQIRLVSPVLLGEIAQTQQMRDKAH